MTGDQVNTDFIDVKIGTHASGTGETRSALMGEL